MSRVDGFTKLSIRLYPRGWNRFKPLVVGTPRDIHQFTEKLNRIQIGLGLDERKPLYLWPAK